MGDVMSFGSTYDRAEVIRELLDGRGQAKTARDEARVENTHPSLAVEDLDHAGKVSQLRFSIRPDWIDTLGYAFVKQSEESQ